MIKDKLKEKVKAAPKELVCRGLDDGTERLRGQLRETAQGGKASDYGGDRIEDAAVDGARRAERSVEALLKKKKSARDRELDKGLRTTDSPAPQESPAEPPAPHEPLPREQPRIRTRETVSARKDGAGAGPPERGRAAPAGERMREARMKIRDSAILSTRPEVPPALQAGSEPPKIKTRDPAPGALHGHSGHQPDRRAIKTRDAYIQSQPVSAPERLPQALVQGKQDLMRERGRTAAIERAEARRTGSSAVPQTGKSGNAAPSAPARRGYAGGQSKYAPAQAVRGRVNLGEPDTRPMREGGRAVIKTARSGRKTGDAAARQTIKTAEKSTRKAIKTTLRTAKTAERTVKTTQATGKAAQRAVQTARATAKAAAATAKAAAKATAAVIKAAIAATQELIAAIAAGGWVILVVVLLICMIGLLVASPFGIFFSNSGVPDAISPPAAIARINSEYADRLSALQTGGTYDRVEIRGRPPAWADVFAVFAAKTAGPEDGESVAVLDADMVEKLRVVFWDMTKITSAETDVEHPAEGTTEAWTEKVMTITVTPRTTDDMRVFYAFTDQQNAALDELLTEENRDMWNTLLYGSRGELVAVALSQVGNVGGQPYWSWYGFSSKVDWCACFVSWCADQCGYIDAGVIPKFSSCSIGAQWFNDRGLWQGKDYEPHPGDLIYFDWDGEDGQDGLPDHVGIVVTVEDGIVHTVEGNSGDCCRQNTYSIGHYEIWGYATPIYN